MCVLLLLLLLFFTFSALVANPKKLYLMELALLFLGGQKARTIYYKERNGSGLCIIILIVK